MKAVIYPVLQFISQLLFLKISAMCLRMDELIFVLYLRL